MWIGPQQVVRGLDINPVIASETLRRLALIFAVGPRALIKLLPNQSKGGRKAYQGCGCKKKAKEANETRSKEEILVEEVPSTESSPGDDEIVKESTEG